MFFIINVVIFAGSFEKKLGLEKSRKIMRLFLPLLFIAYLGESNLFTHSHVIDGVVIVHSHPFKGSHEHTVAQLETIFLLSSFTILSLSAPLTLASIFLVLLYMLAVPATGRAKRFKTRVNISLRAPPVHF